MLIRKFNAWNVFTFYKAVSILLILDVDSEANVYSYLYDSNFVFQSFLFWMLIRKYLDIFDIWLLFNVSILLILDVDSEAGGKVIVWPADYRFQSFLFWMLIRKTAWNDDRLHQFSVSILLILDVDSEVSFVTSISTPSCSVSILLILDVDSEARVPFPERSVRLSFNPSYSGCWFGRNSCNCKYNKNN